MGKQLDFDFSDGARLEAHLKACGLPALQAAFCALVFREGSEKRTEEGALRSLTISHREAARKLRGTPSSVRRATLGVATLGLVRIVSLGPRRPALYVLDVVAARALVPIEERLEEVLGADDCAKLRRGGSDCAGVVQPPLVLERDLTKSPCPLVLVPEQGVQGENESARTSAAQSESVRRSGPLRKLAEINMPWARRGGFSNAELKAAVFGSNPCHRIPEGTAGEMQVSNTFDYAKDGKSGEEWLAMFVRPLDAYVLVHRLGSATSGTIVVKINGTIESADLSAGIDPGLGSAFRVEWDDGLGEWVDAGEGTLEVQNHSESTITGPVAMRADLIEGVWVLDNYNLRAEANFNSEADQHITHDTSGDIKWDDMDAPTNIYLGTVNGNVDITDLTFPVSHTDTLLGADIGGTQTVQNALEWSINSGAKAIYFLGKDGKYYPINAACGA